MCEVERGLSAQPGQVGKENHFLTSRRDLLSFSVLVKVVLTSSDALQCARTTGAGLEDWVGNLDQAWVKERLWPGASVHDG